MNPSCPFCTRTLKLETHNWKSDPLLKRPNLRGDFYVCHRCGKHWPRSASIMRETARDGVKPKPKEGL